MKFVIGGGGGEASFHGHSPTSFHKGNWVVILHHQIDTNHLQPFFIFNRFNPLIRNLKWYFTWNDILAGWIPKLDLITSTLCRTLCRLRLWYLYVDIAIATHSSQCGQNSRFLLALTRDIPIYVTGPRKTPLNAALIKKHGQKIFFSQVLTSTLPLLTCKNLGLYEALNRSSADVEESHRTFILRLRYTMLYFLHLHWNFDTCMIIVIYTYSTHA